jgi:hypothetical protein
VQEKDAASTVWAPTPAFATLATHCQPQEPHRSAKVSQACSGPGVGTKELILATCNKCSQAPGTVLQCGDCGSCGKIDESLAWTWEEADPTPRS